MCLLCWKLQYHSVVPLIVLYFRRKGSDFCENCVLFVQETIERKSLLREQSRSKKKKMAGNGGDNVEDIVEDDDDKYNYYECEYQFSFVFFAPFTCSHTEQQKMKNFK